MEAHTIKKLIENSEAPFLIKGVLDWEILNWDLNQWKLELGDEILECRLGKRNVSNFEPSTGSIKKTFDELINFCSETEWIYFDYKYLAQWLLTKDKIQDVIKWDKFGFKKSAIDSTIWIGTEGAHTPCHIDTYGVNLIAQVYGRKRWILFPPESKLTRSRFPYEESSIYTDINFYAPQTDKFKDSSVSPNCYTVVLEPGQTLFVPNGWWHYVENLDTAISINVWLPMPFDVEKRLEEALVQMIFKSMTSGLNQLKEEIVSTENNNLINTSLKETVNLVEATLGQYKCEKAKLNNRKKVKTDVNVVSSKSKASLELNLDRMFVEHSQHLEHVERLSEVEFESLMDKQGKRLIAERTAEKCLTNENTCKQRIDIGTVKNDSDDFLKHLVNVLSSSDVLDAIKRKLLEN